MVYGGVYRNQSGNISIPLNHYLPLSGGTMTGSITLNSTSQYIYFADTSRYIRTSDASRVVIGANSKTYVFGPGTGGTITGSDERLKKNVITMPNGVLDIINTLRPVKFDFKTDESNESFYAGFIAQEVDALGTLPNLIIPPEDNDENNMYGIDYAGFVPYLVKAIQELSAKVDTLEDKLKSLGL